MIEKLKSWLKAYDAWCYSLGLTPAQKRSCVVHRSEEKGKNV